MSQGLSYDDVIRLCKAISRKDKLKVTFSTDTKRRSRAGSTLSNNGDESSSKSLKHKLLGRLRSKSTASDNAVIAENNENSGAPTDFDAVQGLSNDMELMSVAILVDENGKTIKTYTEFDDIPAEEAEGASRIFMSRVPRKGTLKENEPLPEVANTGNQHRGSDADVGTEWQALEDVLDELSIEKRKKLFKKMRPLLPLLHTTDIRTALSMLDTPRFSKTRDQFKNSLTTFVTVELKMEFE